MSSENSGSFIEIQNITKVFGNNSPEALEAITKKNISKQDALEKYNSVIGVSDVSFDVNPGEIFCVMGLSGSGKSTLVRHINRLLEPTLGKILIDGQDVMALEKNQLQEFRNKKIGMVFQNYALFPHMTVYENLSFPLKVRKVSKDEADKKINKALSMVSLTGFEARMPGQLSGGQQQRVAVARALVFDPKLVLMDEPLGALDKNLRENMQYELKHIHESLGVTVVYVTHDQGEALTMSNRIAVFNEGKIQQLSNLIFYMKNLKMHSLHSSLVRIIRLKEK